MQKKIYFQNNKCLTLNELSSTREAEFQFIIWFNVLSFIIHFIMLRW